MRIALWLHVLGAVVWVGGMFFAHFALRPAAQALPPPQRLALLQATLARFVRWAALAIVAILASGTWLIHAHGGMAAMNAGVHTMTALGIAMTAIYVMLVVGPLRRLSAAVAAGTWEVAGAAMAQVRRLVGINLVLGLATITIAFLVGQG